MSQWPPPMDGPDGWSPAPPPPTPSSTPPPVPPPPGDRPPPPPGAYGAPGAYPAPSGFGVASGYGQASPYGQPTAVLSSPPRPVSGRPKRFGSSFWTLFGVVVVVIGLAVAGLVFLRDDGGDDVADGVTGGLETGALDPAPSAAAPAAPAESLTPAAPPVPAAPAVEPWDRTNVESGIFSVELPSDHTSTHQEIPSPAGIANAQMLLVDRGAWALAVMDLRAPNGSAIDLRGGADGMMASLNGRITSFEAQRSKLVDLADFAGTGTYAGRPITVLGRILRTRGGFAVVYSLAENGAAAEMEPQYLRLRDSLAVNH